MQPKDYTDYIVLLKTIGLLATWSQDARIGLDSEAKCVPLQE